MPVYEPEDFDQMEDPEEMDRAKKEHLAKKKRLKKEPRMPYKGPGEEERRREIADLEATFELE